MEITGSSSSLNRDVASSKPALNGVHSNGVNTNGASKVNGNGAHAGSGKEDTDSVALANLLAVSVIVLRQAIDVLRAQLTTDDQLLFRSHYIPGSTIGKHLRHARDHYELLLDSLNDTGEVVSELSYDVRSRGTPMESSREAACAALESTASRLEAIVPRVRLDAPLTLNAVTPHPQTLGTTFGRELWFAALHAVHHWSMVRVVAGEQNIELEESFGVAPSTLIYHGVSAPLGKPKI